MYSIFLTQRQTNLNYFIFISYNLKYFKKNPQQYSQGTFIRIVQIRLLCLSLKIHPAHKRNSEHHDHRGKAHVGDIAVFASSARFDQQDADKR